MKRIINFAEAFAKEIAGALTPEVKRAICEDAKKVISLTMTGAWALLAIALVSDVEATIKGA